MSFVEVDSKQIYYEEYGKYNNHTIVYFHGGPGESCLSFSHQAKVLGEKYHVISFDQYGVFRSDAISENEICGVKDHVRLIDGMRKALGIESWITLGHSYGGMLACLYAYMYPNYVQAVIYDCPTWNMVLTAKAIASFLIPYFQMNGSEEEIDICKRVLSDGTPREKAFDEAMILSRMMQEDEDLRLYSHTIDPAEYERYMTEHIQQIDTEAENWYKFIRHTQKLMEAGDFYDDHLSCLKEIASPSLLLVGKYDLTCGEDQREYFRKYSRNGIIHEFQNSMHLPWMQEPQAYTDAIVNFLDSVLK